MKIIDVSKKVNAYDVIELAEEGANDFRHCQWTLDGICESLKELPNYQSLENELSDLISFVGRKYFVKGLIIGAKIHKIINDDFSPYCE